LLYRSLDRADDAGAQFRRLLAVSPDHTAARLNLADLELRRGRWRVAEAQYDSALLYDHTRGRAQIRLGQIALRHRRDMSVSLSYFDAAIAAGADADADAHSGRGLALRRLGLDDLALDAYRRATSRDPERTDVWYNIGNLHRDRGEAAPAIDAYRRVIDIGDDEDLARSAAVMIRELESLPVTIPNEQGEF
jgi:tetratricopeptide (TPR) repeat protein